MRAIFDGLMMQWLSEKDPDCDVSGSTATAASGEILHYLSGADASDHPREERGERADDAGGSSGRRCENEGCARPPEPGERVLRRLRARTISSDRDERRREAAAGTRPGGGAPGGVEAIKSRAPA